MDSSENTQIQLMQVQAELTAESMVNKMTEKFIMPMQLDLQHLCNRLDSLEKTIESNNGLKQVMKTMRQTCLDTHKDVDDNFIKMRTQFNRPVRAVARWTWIIIGAVGILAFIGGVVAAFDLRIVMK